MKSLTGQQNSQALLGAVHLFYQHIITLRYLILFLIGRSNIQYHIIVSDGLHV